MSQKPPQHSMYHVIQVGLTTEMLKRLDELRRLYPEAAYRRDIIQALIADAHARLPAGNIQPASWQTRHD